ncbi:ABC transporter permease [Parasulfuritortus cantonensis]|uniref:ABC transporter permease n=1 Tax=Parasulfuritortus cantonensis TaxID=2528202 RepID=A0A4R1BCH7_9PROT|nr:ABC transporter permease [Parasulfuritortus cantonensis]TCJ14750.1 ABC transporter permease [Parasulfuritortus cantonensis]
MADLKVTVYTPESSLRNPRRMLRDMFGDLLAGRELAWQLALRDIKAQYRQTALGLLWAFILPLANTAAWLLIQHTGVVTIRDTGIPYPVFVFTGAMLWAIFMDAVNAPLQQTVAAKPMLAKINFPREALVLSGIYQTLFNAAIKLAVLIPALWLMGVTPGVGLAFLPVTVLSLVLAGTAFGLLLTPVGMLYTDIGKGLPLLMQFFMFLTPVVFPMPSAGWAATLFQYNPLTPLIVTARETLTGFTPHFLGDYLSVNVGMLALLAVVWVVYRAAMPILIERMSA